MKKIIAVLLVFALMLIPLSGCGEKKEEPIRVGIAAPDVTHGWVAGVAYYAKKYCKDNNLTFKLTTSADAEEMIANMNDLVEWGADVLVTWPQWAGMEDGVGKILAQGIPVVSFDVEIDCEGIHKVTGNNYDMGYQSAKYIVNKVGAAAHIAVMDVPSSASVARDRKQGFFDYLNEIGYDQSNVFEIAEPSFSRDAGFKDMNTVLKAHPQVDAVFSMDDENSIGAVQAIRAAGRTDIKAITGGGGMQEYFRMIADAQYADLGLATALYSPSMVTEAIATAMKLRSGEKCDSVIVIPTTVVTAENVSEYLDPENTIY